MNGVTANGIRTAGAIEVLNRLLAAFQYSLASYLGCAHPWTRAENARLLAVVRKITAEHEAHARRIGALILKRRGKIEPGRFPMRFTAYNYLALEYLVPRLVEHKRELIDEIVRRVDLLGGDREAMRLGEDILSSEKRHLRTLTELVSRSRPESKPNSVTSLAA